MSASSSNIKLFNAGTVFKGRKSNNTVAGFATPSPYVPDEDKNYIIPNWGSDIALWFVHFKDPLFIFGPTGCGKTSCLKQFAYKLNYPVYEVTGHNRLEFPELVGHHTVDNGNMRFEYGPLAKAMRDGGIFLMNEVDLLAPDVMAGLNSVLDGSPLCIAENGGEVIKPHSMFRFVATANSNGTGDNTGLYQGVLRMNMAAADRFMAVQADYMDEKSEMNLVFGAYPNLGEETVLSMIKYATVVRNAFRGDATAEMSITQISITMSTRTLLRWAAYVSVLFNAMPDASASQKHEFYLNALRRVLIFKATPTDQLTLTEIFQRVFG